MVLVDMSEATGLVAPYTGEGLLAEAMAAQAKMSPPVTPPTTRMLQEALQQLEDRLDADEEEDLYCVACDKEMRNEKAFAAHLLQR